MLRATLIAIFLAFLSTALSAQVGTFIGAFPQPTSSGYPVSVGAAQDGNLYILLGGGPPQVLRATPSGQLLSSFPAAGSFDAHGIAEAGSEVWLVDAGNPFTPGDEFLRSYSLSGTLLSSLPISANSSLPRRLTLSPNGTLVFLDAWSPPDQALEYTTAGSLAMSHQLATTFTMGIAFDASRCSYWVYDAGSNTVRQYNLQFQELSSFVASATQPQTLGDGVAVIGDILFLAVPFMNQIQMYSLQGAIASPGCQAALEVDTVSPTGLGALMVVFAIAGVLILRRM